MTCQGHICIIAVQDGFMNTRNIALFFFDVLWSVIDLHAKTEFPLDHNRFGPDHNHVFRVENFFHLQIVTNPRCCTFPLASGNACISMQ